MEVGCGNEVNVGGNKEFYKEYSCIVKKKKTRLSRLTEKSSTTNVLLYSFAL